MYIDLKSCLINEVPIIDLDSIKKWNPLEKTYFSWNDDIYYIKRVNFNEFIGEELANQIDSKTVCFEIFQNVNGDIFMASKSFKKTNCTYYYPLDFVKMFPISNHLENLKNICLDQNNYINLLNNIFKMFSIDIYMEQVDRFSNNIQIEQFDTGYTDLAPIYDYSTSAWDDNIMYHNCLYSFIDEDTYFEFYNIYPNFLEILKRIQKVNMSKVLENIENNKEILLPNKIKDIYLRREEISQKKLEKIIKS